MIEQPKRFFVPGTSVYCKDSTDDTHTRLLMKHFSNHMLNRTSHECSFFSSAFLHSFSLFSCAVGLSRSDCRQQGKSACYSVNWTSGDAQLEVLNASTGKRRDSGAPSRLCKHALFARWIRLYRKVSLSLNAKKECCDIDASRCKYVHINATLFISHKNK